MRFIVITLPPAEIATAIDALRRPLNDEAGCREALRYPPHLTLRTGMILPDDRADSVAREFFEVASSLRRVRVQTEDMLFTSYLVEGSPRGLVGWNVRATRPLLALHKGLLHYTAWMKGLQARFHPHLTLAFDDLGLGEVERLRARLTPPPPGFSWTVDHVALFHETREGWLEWGRVALS